MNTEDPTVLQTMITDNSRSLAAVDEIIELIDGLTLLGAAYDCMSDGARAKFKKNVQKIILQKMSK